MTGRREIAMDTLRIERTNEQIKASDSQKCLSFCRVFCFIRLLLSYYSLVMVPVAVVHLFELLQIVFFVNLSVFLRFDMPPSRYLDSYIPFQS